MDTPLSHSRGYALTINATRRQLYAVFVSIWIIRGTKQFQLRPFFRKFVKMESRNKMLMYCITLILSINSEIIFLL
jgi:hypothetical protein